MAHHMYIVETGPARRNEWPSIAAASAQLRRPRHLRALPAPADSRAVLSPLATLGPFTPTPADRRQS